MLGTAFFSRVRAAAGRFSAATDGNIAAIFAIAAVPIICFMGVAVDYSRANSARSSMQAALDSTALMVAKDLSSGTITAAQISAKAQAYFTALYTNTDAKSVTVNATYTAASSSSTSTIQISGSGVVNTDFLKFAGYSPTIGFGTSSTSTWGNAKMRVALVLDNTGSMKDNGKITALRNAVAGTGGLIDQLSALSKTNGDVYISVIPFAKVVNVGASNYTQSYIDWTDWLNPPTTQPANGSTQASLPMNWHAVGPGAKCPWTNSNGGFVCQNSPTNTSTVSTIQSSGYICPSVDYNSHTLYNGCWVSTQVGTTAQVFCTGSNSCSCPKNSSGNNVSGCSCGTTSGVYSCSGYIYTHDWTQPGPNDTTHNSSQPRVSAVVGWTNNKWTSTTQTPTVTNNWTQASTDPITNWTGCITDRTQPNDATGVLADTHDVTTQFPANEYYENSTAYCSSNASTPLEPIIPLSYNWSALKTAVNAMQPTGGTNQAVGLAWGWQSLLPNGPLNTPAEDSSATYNRVIILLSDGLNTEDRWPDYGDGSSQANGNPIDARQTLMCQNLQSAKDSNGNPMYTIYTIQVNTNSRPDPTSTVLQNCASSPDKFYMLTSSSQIVTTFNSIGTALSKLRVAK
jgi:Flp pilus assembly protein TadG